MLPCLDDLLKHENIEIRRITKDGLCSEYMEASLLLKNKFNGSIYLRSLLNIPTRSVAIYPSNRLEIKDEATARYMVVKSKFLLKSNEFYHDFAANPIFELKVDLQVDCSNLLHTPIDSLFVSALNANEKRHKHNKTITELAYDNNPFVWTGKTKWKIEKDIQGTPLSKSTDLSQYKADLQSVENILHWAIMDSKTCEFWAKSEGFEFSKYTDDTIKADDNLSKDVDERECLLQYFKMHGNVKSYLGLRLMKEKFAKNKDGYEDDRHFVRFFNEKKTLFGCAGRTDSCILVAIYEKPQNKPITPAEPDCQISMIYDRLFDFDNHFHEKTFHEMHTVSFTAMFTAPGVYNINHLAFHSSQNEAIQTMNNLEEVKVVIKNRATAVPVEANLLDDL